MMTVNGRGTYSGSPCSTEGLACTYPSCYYGVPIEADCSGGTWSINDPVGIGPVCSCPAELPTAGASCDSCCSEVCPFAPAGTCGPSAQCTSGGTWQVTVPPCPPPEACSALTTAVMCASLSNCRWLVPGCGTTGFTAGCFDAADCDPSAGCPSGQSCVTVNTNPCWDSNCNVCSGGQADICTGPG